MEQAFGVGPDIGWWDSGGVGFVRFCVEIYGAKHSRVAGGDGSGAGGILKQNRNCFEGLDIVARIKRLTAYRSSAGDKDSIEASLDGDP